MNDPYLEKVLQLADVVSPVEQPKEDDWKALEREMGVRLPEDMKLLITSLGSGYFGEFSLLNPCSSSKYTRLSRAESLIFKGLIDRVANEAGISLYPEPNGLLQVGAASHRMDLLLQLQSEAKDYYTCIWLDQDSRTADAFRITVSQFLYELYHGTLSAAWTEEVRTLIWQPGERFFVPQPGSNKD